MVFQDLERAIRRESNQAVCHWWGVTGQTVSKWRKALGVDTTNEGTRQLRVNGMDAHGDALRAKVVHDDPERCRKIAASKLGKKRPRHVIQAMRSANLGRKATDETRRKLSEASRRRGARPPKAGRPWTPEEDELLAQSPVKIVAEKTGRTMQAVYDRRHERGMPDGRRNR